MSTRSEYVIAPPKGLVSINWAELWRFRDLFVVLAWRDIAVRYKQTVLGVAWAVLQPLVTMVVLTFIFGSLAGMKSDSGTPYPILVFVGVLFWQYFSGTLTNASNSMVTNAALVQKIYFPRLIIPATSATTSMVDFGIASTILGGMMVYYGYVPQWTGLAILPLLLASAVLSALGVGMFLAAINVKYRDVRHAVPFVIQIMMYVTPVGFDLSKLDNFPVIKSLMVWLHPISGVITNARAGLLGEGTLDWSLLAITLFVSVVYFLGGLYVFRNTERYFADIV